MVKAATVKQSNARYASEHHEGLVCVFSGATSGIGAGTLERMALMLHAPILYVIGRSAQRFASQRTKLEKLNPSCKVVFLEAQVSLLSDIDAVSQQIIAAEKKVDFLYMSPGHMPLNGPQYTREGIPMIFAISYYCRVRLLSNLLPLLCRSQRPRVLSVLNGGRERPMIDEDIDLEHHFSWRGSMNHCTTMTTLALEHLAENDKQITFFHAFPGLVSTDIFARLTATESAGMIWRLLLVMIRGLAAMAMLLFGMSTEASGERQAFLLTSDSYRPGVWRINPSSDRVSAPGVLQRYREDKWQEKIWEHTVCKFDKALAMGSDGVPN